jgi:hypothetical protein
VPVDSIRCEMEEGIMTLASTDKGPPCGLLCEAGVFLSSLQEMKYNVSDSMNSKFLMICKGNN